MTDDKEMELKMRIARLVEENEAMRSWFKNIEVSLQKLSGALEYIEGKYLKTVEK